VEFHVHLPEEDDNIGVVHSGKLNHTCWFEVNHVLEEGSVQCQLVVWSQLGRILPNCNQERG